MCDCVTAPLFIVLYNTVVACVGGIVHWQPWQGLFADACILLCSGASWITQALLLCLGSIQRSMPIIAATFMAVILAWITSVRLLNKQLQVNLTLDSCWACDMRNSPF